MTLTRARKTGRLANGAERGGGKIAHLVNRRDWRSDWTQAVCGTFPGRLTGGWDWEPPDSLPTCKTCEKRRSH